jgi:ribosome-associated protein
MRETPINANSKKLSELVAQGMLEKKGYKIIILDLKDISQSVADYFVICSGNSVNQVDALADSIEDIVYQNTSELPWHKEGKENKEWILLDYVDVVAHVFKSDRRDFYAIEELWGDAKLTYLELPESIKNPIEQSLFL